MLAMPLLAARCSAPPGTAKCLTHTAGCFTLTKAACASERLRFRIETGTAFRLPLRTATLLDGRSMPALPRSGVVAANIQ